MLDSENTSSFSNVKWVLPSLLMTEVTMKKLAIGDVVELKCGGPLMTVFGITDDGVILCEWFNRQNTVEQKGFFPAELRKAPES
jgi:uncharacterized protein YodC (DUF2158 family)